MGMKGLQRAIIVICLTVGFSVGVLVAFVYQGIAGAMAERRAPASLLELVPVGESKVYQNR